MRHLREHRDISYSDSDMYNNNGRLFWISERNLQICRLKAELIVYEGYPIAVAVVDLLNNRPDRQSVCLYNCPSVAQHPILICSCASICHLLLYHIVSIFYYSHTSSIMNKLSLVLLLFVAYGKWMFLLYNAKY